MPDEDRSSRSDGYRAGGGAGMGVIEEVRRLPPMKEEPVPAPVSTIQIDEVTQEAAFDPSDHIDKSIRKSL